MTKQDQPANRVWIAGHNRGAKAAAIAAYGKPAAGHEVAIELAVLAPVDAAEAAYFAAKIADRLAAGARLNVVIETPPADADPSKVAKETAEVMTTLGWQVARRAPLDPAHVVIEFRRA